MKTIENLKRLAAEGLSKLKAQSEKENEIYKHGVDLTNFEKEPEEHLKVMIAEIVGCSKEEIDWWLYESVEKAYWVTQSPEEPKQKFDVESPEEFIAFFESR